MPKNKLINKKHILIFCFLLFSLNYLKAQEDKSGIQLQEEKPDTLLNFNYLKINLGMLLVSEPIIYYEIFIKKNKSIEIGAGYNFAIGNPNGAVASGIFSPIEFRLYRGPMFDIAFKFHKIKTNHSLYFSPLLFYRYQFYDKKVLWYQSGSEYDENCELLSKRKHVFGLKTLFGYTVKKDAIVDIYWGLGLRIKYIKSKVHAGNTGYDCPEMIDRQAPSYSPYYREIWPSIHLGLKIGIKTNTRSSF